MEMKNDLKQRAKREKEAQSCYNAKAICLLINKAAAR